MSLLSSQYREIAVEMLKKIGLIGLVFVIVWTCSYDIASIANDQVTLTDLLLIPIYICVSVIVGRYFDSELSKFQFLLYVAIVALARYLILDIKRLAYRHSPYTGTFIPTFSLRAHEVFL